MAALIIFYAACAIFIVGVAIGLRLNETAVRDEHEKTQEREVENPPD